jgi:prepilin-type N-terminal cleavage/methylation domain-containing protein
LQSPGWAVRHNGAMETGLPFRPRQRFPGSGSRGFTLIEISIVLVIAALLIAAGVGISVAMIDNTRARVTRQNMEAVKLALQGFIARNGRLPCPAVETLLPTDNLFGLEAATPGTCTGTVDLPGGTFGAFVVDAAKRGVAPWKALGLTLEAASDGWGNQLTYMVTVTATGKNFDTLAGMRGSIYVHSTTPVAAGLPGTGNQLNACSTTANDNMCNKAAVAVLISHGRNIFGAYTSQGVRAPLPTGAAEVENTNADRFVVNAEPSTTFDDLLIPLTPDDLLAPLAAQGAIKGERALLLAHARQVVVLIAAHSVANDRSGSPGSYQYNFPSVVSSAAYTFDATKSDSNCNDYNPPTAAGLLPAGHSGKKILDPWGREFRYAFGNSYISADESCPHPVALVSLGANGVANGDPNVVAGSDDWVYYVPLAEWKEIFGKAGW